MDVYVPNRELVSNPLEIVRPRRFIVKPPPSTSFQQQRNPMATKARASC